MTNITISMPREDLENAIQHFGVAINSVGAIISAPDDFHDHLETLSNTLIDHLLVESEAPEPETPAETTNPGVFSEVVGYSVFDSGDEKLPSAGVWPSQHKVEELHPKIGEDSNLKVAQIRILKED